MTGTRHTVEKPSLEYLRRLREEIISAAVRHGASNVRVYGSVARGTSGPDSDIDLLVDMSPGASLLDLAALHLELEDLLGFPVELATDVKPRLRERVYAEAVAL
ncbi:MAG: nucleotidyltransferase family protein [Acidimicrobiia bacterium]|nr:nucleotidyltransferase family protein [Acidimicrobiia bacterium]